MSASLRAPLLALLVLAVGCNQAALPGTGGLNGVGTVSVVRLDGADGGAVVDAQYGQIAFLTSANSDDLKGLQLILTDPTQLRNYVPAPNPLQPLSIPVVNQPVELAPSVRYGQITTFQPYFPGNMDGQVLTGMLLFVRGSASPNISVVGTANVPESLRQLTNGLLIQSAGLVTAISARLTANEQNVVLYYATFDGENATVWERVLQHPETTSPNFTGPFPTSLTYLLDCGAPPPAPTYPLSTLYVCPQRAVRTYENASVSALQVLPTTAADPVLPVLGGLEGGRLGVALRNLVAPLNDATLSNSGEVLIIDPAVPSDTDATGASIDPNFRIARYFAPFIAQPPRIPGAPAQPPVRALLTHPRAYNVYADGGTIIGPDGYPGVLAYEGARLFAVLDEASCHGSLNCAGIIAVDASPTLADGGANANYGLLAFDGSDCLTMSKDTDPVTGQVYGFCANEVGMTNRMLPLRVGTGVIQGVAFESSVSFPAPTSFTQGLVSLLGVVTISAESLDHSAPQIFFFDALGLRALNENAGPGITNGITLIVPATGLTAQLTGDGGFIIADAGTGLYPITETLTITNLGEIPGLSLIQGIPYDAGILANGEIAPILAWPVPDAGAVIAANVLEVNDGLFPINLSGTICTYLNDAGVLTTPFASVVGVDDAGANIFTDAIDLRLCPGASGYIVFAGPHSEFPLLVSGSSQGLLGRMAAGTLNPDGTSNYGPVFVVPNSITNALGLLYPRFYNPDVPPGSLIQGDFIFPPGSDAGVYTPPLALQMGGPDPSFTNFDGSNYTFIFSSGFLGAALPIDEVGLGFGGLFLPGGAAQTRIIDVNGEFILDVIAFPSSNTVIDYVPSNLLLNTPNSGPINVHF
jgi:hypothetical protein